MFQCLLTFSFFIPTSRSALMLYRQILDAIEANGYDNFTMRAYVPKSQKFASLPAAFMRAYMPPKVRA